MEFAGLVRVLYALNMYILDGFFSDYAKMKACKEQDINRKPGPEVISRPTDAKLKVFAALRSRIGDMLPTPKPMNSLKVQLSLGPEHKRSFWDENESLKPSMRIPRIPVDF